MPPNQLPTNHSGTPQLLSNWRIALVHPKTGHPTHEIQKWKPLKLAKTLFPCVSDSILATACTAFWGLGFGCQSVSKHFGVLLSYQMHFQTSLIYITFLWSMEKLSAQSFSESEALAVFSSASNFSRCALRRSMLHKEILDILEI